MGKPSYLFRGKANRDNNEPAFTALLAHWHIEFSYGNPGDGYDLLVQVAPLELWEIKNPEQSAHDRKLTTAELAKQAYCKERGILYLVFEYTDQAAEHLSNHFANGGK